MSNIYCNTTDSCNTHSVHFGHWYWYWSVITLTRRNNLNFARAAHALFYRFDMYSQRWTNVHKANAGDQCLELQMRRLLSSCCSLPQCLSGCFGDLPAAAVSSVTAPSRGAAAATAHACAVAAAAPLDEVSVSRRSMAYNSRKPEDHDMPYAARTAIKIRTRTKQVIWAP